MEKRGRLRHYRIKALKETLLIAMVSLILFYIGIKLDNSILFELLSNLKNELLIIGVILFFIWYSIIYGVNYIYGEMDLRSKSDKKYWKGASIQILVF